MDPGAPEADPDEPDDAAAADTDAAGRSSTSAGALIRAAAGRYRPWALRGASQFVPEAASALTNFEAKYALTGQPTYVLRLGE